MPITPIKEVIIAKMFLSAFTIGEIKNENSISEKLIIINDHSAREKSFKGFLALFIKMYS